MISNINGELFCTGNSCRYVQFQMVQLFSAITQRRYIVELRVRGRQFNVHGMMQNLISRPEDVLEVGIGAALSKLTIRRMWT